MKTLKDYVRTHARLEASMAEEYHMSETLGYSTEYMQRFKDASQQVWNDKVENTMNDEIVEGNGWARRLMEEFKTWVHNFVIHNSTNFSKWHQ
jgi:hypothetical protein